MDINPAKIRIVRVAFEINFLAFRCSYAFNDQFLSPVRLNHKKYLCQQLLANINIYARERLGRNKISFG